MARVETLELVVDVVDQFSDEFATLIAELELINREIERLDGKDIDIDVDLNAEAAALKASVLEGLTGASFAERAPVGGGGDGDAGDVARSLSETADATTDATRNLDIFNLRMSEVHNALARLVPLIVVMIGAVPAVVAGMVTLGTAALAAAAALGGLTAFGALGFAIAEGGRENLAEGFKRAIEDIRDAFLDAFVPLAKRLSGTFESALDGLEKLFERIAARGDVLVAFADVARDFGEFLLGFLPKLIADIGRFADATAPAIARFAELFEGVDVLGALANFLDRLLPEMITFTKILLSWLPAIVKISEGFLRVLNLFGAFAKVIVDVTAALVGGKENLGLIVGLFLMFVSVMGVAIGLTKLFALVLTSRAVVGLASFVTSLLAGEIALTGFSGALAVAIPSLITFAALVVIATGGLALLGAAASGLMQKFFGVSDSIDRATSSLKRFQRAQSGFGGAPTEAPNPFGAPNRVPTGAQSGIVAIQVSPDDDRSPRQQARDANQRLSGPRRRQR